MQRAAGGVKVSPHTRYAERDLRPALEPPTSERVMNRV
jgi:hypothetical protein